MNNNTHLCIDLKTKLVNDKRMVPGKTYIGTLQYNVTSEQFPYEELIIFTEMQATSNDKQYPTIFEGVCVNVHQREDGSLYPTLKQPRFTVDYTFQDFCSEASRELAQLPCLLEEEKEEAAE